MEQDQSPRKSLELACLLSDYRAGREPALEEILRRAMSELRRTANGISHGEQGGPSGSELLQTAWVERIEPALRPGGPEVQNSQHLLGLFRRMLRLSLVDLRRRRGAMFRGGGRKRQQIAEDEVTAGGDADCETRLDVVAALQALPAEDRAVLLLRNLEGRSRRETAELLGLTEAEVRTRRSKASTVLRTMLQAYRLPSDHD